MRIISGEHKGYRFPQRNMPHARPTTDRAKEALFNVLDQKYYFDQIEVLDLYSGLGSVSLEFLSRGCPKVVAIEQNFKSVRYISEIAKHLKLELDLKQNRVLKYLKNTTEQFDIVFADPPYQATQEIKELIDVLAGGDYLKPNGVFVLEHISSYTINHPNCYESRKYGQSTFSFFNFESAK
jgi:16S rRNA (guanine966-N2)-methyltransferase